MELHNKHSADQGGSAERLWSKVLCQDLGDVSGDPGYAGKV